MDTSTLMGDDWDEILMSTLDNLPEGIILTQPSGEIVYVNEMTCQFYGYQPSEMLGKPIYAFSPSTSHDIWYARWSSTLTHKELHQLCNLVTKAGGVTQVNTTAKAIRLGQKHYLCFILQDVFSDKDPNELLRILSEGTAYVIGGDFFRSLAYHLVVSLDTRFALIAECANVAKTRVRTLVYYKNDKFLDDYEYDVEGTPCAILMKGQQYYCEDNLEKIFPRETGSQSYFGVPVFQSDGEVIGHIAVFDNKARRISQQQMNIMRIFASRVGAEIERKRKDEIIQETAVRYKTLFEDSPIGLLEEDLSHLKKYLDHLKEQHADLRTWFDQHPEELYTCQQLIQPLHVNKAMCDLFGYVSAEAYYAAFPKHFQPEVFKNSLLTLDAGKLTYEREVSLTGPQGDTRYMIAKRAILPGYEADWAKSIVSCVDITPQKLSQEKLTVALREVEELKARLEAENIYLQSEIKLQHNFEEIISQSPVFQKTLEKVELVAQTDATVLILGESGTGKELIARAIHNIGKRNKRPLVKVNCAALPANLIESELFGHEKGAFTGAIAAHVGRFELADGGTIFLDEIGEVPLELQSKLLRVLQEGEFERLGSSKTRQVDVRIIAATNRDLSESVNQKEFRADLFYRLNVFPIHMPPLRERKEDIPLLVHHFCRKYEPKLGRQIQLVPKNVLDILQAYDWPGNIRELENVIERALIISRGNILELGDWLPHAYNIPILSATKEKTLFEVEKKHILDTLEMTGWKIRGAQGAAQALGLNPTTLEARMKKLGILRKDSKTPAGESSNIS